MTIFVNFFEKKCQVFGHFLTFNWQFSGRSAGDQSNAHVKRTRLFIPQPSFQNMNNQTAQRHRKTIQKRGVAPSNVNLINHRGCEEGPHTAPRGEGGGGTTLSHWANQGGKTSAVITQNCSLPLVQITQQCDYLPRLAQRLGYPPWCVIRESRALSLSKAAPPCHIHSPLFSLAQK